MNVIEGMPAEYRSIFVEILGRRDPELLSALSVGEPSREQREAVEDILADEFTDNLGPGHEPTARGALIDDALGAFLLRWPIEREPA